VSKVLGIERLIDEGGSRADGAGGRHRERAMPVRT
jgi:hypothetical protein